MVNGKPTGRYFQDHIYKEDQVIGLGQLQNQRYSRLVLASK
jgi:hypothetical protein